MPSPPAGTPSGCLPASPPHGRGNPPFRLDIADLDAPAVSASLDRLGHDRGNSDRTRSARLAAIHSLFGYAALRCPEHSADIERVPAIPPRNTTRTIVTCLTEPEADALLAAPDTATRTDAVTMPGCCPRSRPGCGHPSSPG